MPRRGGSSNCTRFFFLKGQNGLSALDVVRTKPGQLRQFTVQAKRGSC